MEPWRRFNGKLIGGTPGALYPTRYVFPTRLNKPEVTGLALQHEGACGSSAAAAENNAVALGEYGSILLPGGKAPPPFFTTFGTPLSVHDTDPLSVTPTDPVSIDLLLKYSELLCAQMGIKLKVPLQICIKDRSLPPHFAVVYAVVSILDQDYIEHGSFKFSYATSAFLMRALGALELIYSDSSKISARPFVNTIVTVVDMAVILMQLLADRKAATSRQSLRAVQFDILDPLSETIFYNILYVIRQGIQLLERTGPTGPEIAFDVTSLVDNILQIEKNVYSLGDASMICACLDIFGEIGPAIGNLIQELTLNDLVLAVLRFRYDYSNPSQCSAEAASKAGRTIGKLCSIPRVAISSSMTRDMFTYGFVSLGQLDDTMPISIRSNWSWALAELAQCFEKQMDIERPPANYVSLTGGLVQYITLVNEGPVKSRYNGYRACGNLFKSYYPFPHLSSEDINQFGLSCMLLVKELLLQVGNGKEYKNRWNAAFGLGCVFENESLVEYFNRARVPVATNYAGSLMDELCFSLSSWVKTSQNYKEKIQCLVALRKAKSRRIFGTDMYLVFARICHAIQVYPAEDQEKMMEKFEIEVVITLCALLTLLTPQDGICVEQGVFPYLDSIQTICGKVASKMVGDQVDIIVQARDRLLSIQDKLNGTTGTKDMLADLLTTLNIYLLEEYQSEFSEGIGNHEDIGRFSMMHI